MKWRHALSLEQARAIKFHTIYHPEEWNRAVSTCLEGCQPALRKLRNKIYGTTYEDYLLREITPAEFVDALQ